VFVCEIERRRNAINNTVLRRTETQVQVAVQVNYCFDMTQLLNSNNSESHRAISL